MAIYRVQPGDTIALSVALYDGATNQYPQAKLYQTDGTLITTKNLTHSTGGLYQVEYTPDGTYKQITVHIIIYSDSGHTTENTGYNRTMDSISVGYDYKAPMGAPEFKLTKKDIDKLTDSLKKIVDLDSLKEAIGKKSEFDPQKDTVKTDIKIPATSLREVNSKLDELKQDIKKAPITKDYTNHFIRLEKALKSPKDEKQVLAELRRLGALFAKTNKPVDTDSIKRGLASLEKMLEVFNIEEHKRNQAVKSSIESLKTFLIPFLAGISMTKQQEVNDKFNTILETLDKNEG